MDKSSFSLVERAAARLRADALAFDGRGLAVATEDKPRFDEAGPSALAGEPSPGTNGVTNGGTNGGPRARTKGVTPPLHTPPPPRRSRRITLDRARLAAAGIPDWTQGRSKPTEEYRLIKRQVLHQAFGDAGEAKDGSNLVMVTSARPGEGKTFTAFNLALSVAMERDHQVLLIDADSAQQRVRRLLGVDEEAGLLNLLSDPSLELADLMLRTDLAKFAVLLAGNAPDFSAELFAAKGMRSLLYEMARRHNDRLILLDTPPCLFSSDPTALAALVGQVILVVEAGRTQRSDVDASLEVLAACPNVSLVLNKTQTGLYGSYPYGADLRAAPAETQS
jgi:receptor protein-tyrosine kinase